jgi:hypothetical protein
MDLKTSRAVKLMGRRVLESVCGVDFEGQVQVVLRGFVGTT